MPHPLVSASDLTGKARLRHSALYLFATKGFASTSLRRVAQRAAVSLALIGHHFGSKADLREAVDQWALQMLHGAIANVALSGKSVEAIGLAMTRELRALLATEVDLASYLRRAVMDDAGRGDSRLLGMFLQQVWQMLDFSDPDHGEQELAWWQRQVFVQVLGQVVMEPILRGQLAGTATPRGPSSRKSAVDTAATYDAEEPSAVLLQRLLSPPAKQRMPSPSAAFA